MASPIIRNKADRERVRKWLHRFNTRYCLTMVDPEEAEPKLCGPSPKPKPRKKRSKR